MAQFSFRMETTVTANRSSNGERPTPEAITDLGVLLATAGRKADALPVMRRAERCDDNTGIDATKATSRFGLDQAV